jgi:uncharacterized repeat protein (TIGR01451 family)
VVRSSRTRFVTLVVAPALAAGALAAGASSQAPPTVAIGDVTVTEANAGTVGADFAVTLSRPSAERVRVNFTNADGSAVAPDDYTATNRPLVFEPGQTSKVVTVPVVGDLFDEGDEFFLARLSRPGGAVLGDQTGVGVIRDNDPRPGRAPVAPTPAPVARLTLTKTASPNPPVVGQPLTYTLTVRNHGPATATGVTVVDVLPSSVRLRSTSPQGSCNVVGLSVTCGEPSRVGCGPPTCAPSTGLSLAPGQSAVFQIVVVPLRAVGLFNRAGLSADQARATGEAGVFVHRVRKTLPAPVAGRTFVLRTISGKVYVRYPPRRGRARAAIRPGRNDRRFFRLRTAATVPVRSTVDVEEGRVEMLAARNLASTQVQRAQFFRGVFVARQRRTRRPVAEASLVNRYRRACGIAPRRSGRASAARSRKRLGRLFANGRGRFRTRGRFSAATVRGTIWLVEDRCDGTRTSSIKGRVSVFDRVKRRRVTLRTGDSYVARATRAAIRRFATR